MDILASREVAARESVVLQPRTRPLCRAGAAPAMRVGTRTMHPVASNRPPGRCAASLFLVPYLPYPCPISNLSSIGVAPSTSANSRTTCKQLKRIVPPRQQSCSKLLGLTEIRLSTALKSSPVCADKPVPVQSAGRRPLATATQGFEDAPFVSK